ncbi:unnamed protein product, partial [Pneumocystis jirovecii]
MFLGLSGYRKIPGNTCDDKYGVMKDKKIKIPCSKDNYSDKIIVKSEDFKGDLINYFYIKSKFNDPNDPNDVNETIIILTSEMEIYISHNQGNEWTQILEKESIISIFQNNYADEEIYLLGFENNAWVSRDRFTEIEKITLPAYSHIGYTNFEFHPDNKNWIIYTGCKEKELLRECEAISYYSIDGGKSSDNDVIKGAPKHIKTLITYNDGGEWVYLTPPEKDSNGDKYCSGKLEKCSLNLHGYTERVDFRNTFSSDKVPGLDFAVGNVGEYLDNYLNSNTFMTKDGGITWKEVQKGPYMWKFGDQGSILLLTKDKYFSDHFYYSLDMGNTWQIVYFPSKESFLVYDITTVYSDTSRKFVLFCIKNKSSSTMTTIYIDFTMLTDKKCELNEEFQDKSDFDIWSFQYPKKSSCLFGHVKNYYRKKPNRLCFIGNSPIKYYISKNCTCEVEDYECDYNYERVSNGTCQLVKGVNPPNHLDECKKYNLIEYYKPTGYRRIPLTTCQGGKELDKDSLPIPCPGKESEYRKLRKSLGGFGLFLIIISPFIIIILSGYCMWALYRDRFL